MSTTASRPLGLVSLIRAAGKIEDFVENRLSEVDLSIPRLAALQRLADAGGVLPLGQLAERLACVKSNVTQLVDRLVADGLVAREIDPTDKRSRRAVLTEAGRRAREEGARIQREAEEVVFAALSTDDRERLSDILDKLKGQLHHGRC